MQQPQRSIGATGVSRSPAGSLRKEDTFIAKHTEIDTEIGRLSWRDTASRRVKLPDEQARRDTASRRDLLSEADPAKHFGE